MTYFSNIARDTPRIFWGNVNIVCDVTYIDIDVVDLKIWQLLYKNYRPVESTQSELHIVLKESINDKLTLP